MIYLACSQSRYLRTGTEQREMARYLLRLGLVRSGRRDPRHSPLIRNIWGKPFFRDHRAVYFSISHCTGGVAVSISSVKTGIDIEQARPFSMVAARKVLTDRELATVMAADNPDRQFFRFWTLKESFAKALGTGLAYPLRHIEFTIGPDLGVQASKSHCTFRLLENDRGYITAVCHLTRPAGLTGQRDPETWTGQCDPEAWTGQPDSGLVCLDLP